MKVGSNQGSNSKKGKYRDKSDIITYKDVVNYPKNLQIIRS
jgi:hypothetical protein